jgi:hypothetical protein
MVPIDIFDRKFILVGTLWMLFFDFLSSFQKHKKTTFYKGNITISCYKLEYNK